MNFKEFMNKEPEFVTSYTDEQLMKLAYTAKSSDDNPFPEDSPNYQKWFDYYMQHNMRDHTIN